MLAPLTGLDITTEDLDRAGERIRNLDRALQIRNSGRSRAVDSTAEWVFEYPEKSDGTRLDRETFDRILDSYYDHRGWDRETGWPTRARLEIAGAVRRSRRTRAALKDRSLRSRRHEQD